MIRIKSIYSKLLVVKFIMNPNDNSELVLQQLQQSYDRLLDLKKTLENKATFSITTTGLIITLIFGFTSFLANNQFRIFPLVYILIGLAVYLAILSLRNSISALKIANYYFPFVNASKNTISLVDVINDYKSDKSITVLDKITDSYLTGIKINDNLNQEKAQLVNKSQKYLYFSIYTISVIVIILAIELLIHFL
jgi:hypothetical protein